MKNFDFIELAWTLCILFNVHYPLAKLCPRNEEFFVGSEPAGKWWQPIPSQERESPKNIYALHLIAAVTRLMTPSATFSSALSSLQTISK